MTQVLGRNLPQVAADMKDEVLRLRVAELSPTRAVQAAVHWRERIRLEVSKSGDPQTGGLTFLLGVSFPQAVCLHLGSSYGKSRLGWGA